MPETFAQPDDLGELRASELHTSLGERLGAQAGEAFMGGSRTLLRAGQYALAEKGLDTFEPDEMGGGRFVATRDHPDLPIADAKARVQQEGLEHHFKLPDQPAIKQGVLDLMVQHAHERRQYEAAVSRGPQGFLPGALGFVTELGAGIIDPVNIAAFSIPVVGEARMGMMLAGAGTSMLARAGIKAGVGAAQGAVGGALLAPADWWLHTRDGVDYTMTDALHSIVLSAGMGGAFHSGFGFLGDLRSRYRGMPMAGTPEDLRVRALMGDTRAGDVVERGALTGDRTAAPSVEDVPGVTPEGMSREQAHLAVYDDAMSQLKAAGMADEEAAHNAAIVAARYATRAERLGGAENAFDLYRNEGLSIGAGEGEPGGVAAGGRSFDQSQPTAPTFFSAVLRTVETGKLNKGSPDQWLATIKNTPGVKAEELEWLGLADWLKQQKGSVTKEQVAEYVRANQIEVREVEKGPPVAVAETPGRAEVRPAPDGRGWVIWDTENDALWIKEEGAGMSEADARDQADMINGDRREMRRTDERKFTSYMTPAGGENARELVITLPAATLSGRGEVKPGTDPTHPFDVFVDGELVERATSQQNADAELARAMSERGADVYRVVSAHSYGDAASDENRLVHIFTDDRMIDGKRTLLIREGQSDWHQAGQAEGYRGDKAAILSEYREAVRQANEHPPHSPEYDAGYARAQKLASELNDSSKVPDAPFKTTWPDLIMKRMIRYAAENGYEQLAWVRGETAADRYDLSKQVSELRWNKKTHNLQAKNHEGRTVIDKTVPPEDLPGAVGKETADKLINQELAPSAEPPPASGNWLSRVRKATEARPEDVAVLSGLDLKVGGKFVLDLYNKRFVEGANKIGKKYGARVGEAELNTKPPDAFEIHEALDGEETTGYSVYRRGANDDPVMEFQSRAEAEAWVRVNDPNSRWFIYEQQDRRGRPEWAVRDRTTGDEVTGPFVNLRAAEQAIQELSSENATHTVHTLPITPELRDAAVSQGFPLFQGGAEGGPRGRIDLAHNKAVITLFAKADKSTFMHEAGHLWLDELVRDARRENVPQALSDDLGTVLRWLGVDKAEDIGTEQHEKWARGFEAYLAEGNAPSTALAKAFETFKQWLKAIYHSLTQLDAPLNSDIRGVMDRMLATDGELLARPRPAEILADLPARVREDVQRAATADVINGNAVRAGELLEEAAKQDPRIAESVNAERVDLAAVSYEGKVYTGQLHSDAVGKLIEERGMNEQQFDREYKKIVQGYVTTSGRFLERGEVMNLTGATKPIHGDATYLVKERPLVREQTASAAPAARGPRARPPETWSLLEFIASRGGIDPNDPLIADLRSSIGRNNKFIPGFGHLIREGGMRLDRAREAAVEAGYMRDAGDVTGGEATTNVDSLLQLADRELRGERVYREGAERGKSKADQKHIDEREQFEFDRELAHTVEEAGGDPALIDDKTRARVLEIMQREGERDFFAAYERALMEQDHNATEAGEIQQGAGPIPGWDADHADGGAAPGAGGGAARGPLAEGAGPGGPVRSAGDNAGQRPGKADWQRVADAKRGDDAELITASNEAKVEPEPLSIDPKKSISAAEKAAAEADQLLADILPSLTEEERTLFEDMLNKAAADKTAQEDIIRQGAACLLAAAI